MIGKVNTITIVSLSSGILGEPFVNHELAIGLKRLKEKHLNVKFSSNARKGIDYLKQNPEARAKDLIEAFSDPETDMILCAIGGDDTYRLLPYLFEHDELAAVWSRFLIFLITAVTKTVPGSAKHMACSRIWMIGEGKFFSSKPVRSNRSRKPMRKCCAH